MVEAVFDLEAGHRYVLAYFVGGLVLIDDEFARDDAAAVLGRVYNYEATATLTVGRIFGGTAQPFDAFTDIPAQTLSDEEDEIPAGDWDLVSSVGGGVLDTGCFSLVTTEAGWRGILNPDFLLALDAWPPSLLAVPVLCS